MRLALACAATLALLTVDVRVGASAKGQVNNSKLPSCLTNQAPCVLPAFEGIRKISLHGRELGLERGAIIEHRDEDTIQVIVGRLYVESPGPIRVQSAFGSFSCHKECRALVERGTDMTLANLGGEWTVRRLGDAQAYAVAEGLQASLGAVGTVGQSAMEFPQSLHWEHTLRAWARLYPGSVATFTAKVREFRPLWREAVESASQLHEIHAGRTLASHAEAQARAEARRRAVEAENAELRRLFRSKSSIYP